MPTVTSFKYLGSLFTSEGGSVADVNNRIRIGWIKWKEVSGVMCDMPVELKDKVFKTIIRPAMTYGSERWEQTKFIRNEDVEMGKRKDAGWTISNQSNQIKFYLVTHNLQYVHFIKSDVTEEIL